LDPGSERVLVVEAEVRGIRLLDFLARMLPGLRAAAARQLVAAGEVTVNGEDCLHDRRLRVGDVVMLPATAGSGPAAAPRRQRRDEPLAVLAETATALVVDKPPGLPTVPTRDGRDGGVHAQLAALRPGQDLRIVHRLDRDTSGCLLLAKGLVAAQHFDRQFSTGLVQKTYLAVVDGAPLQDEFAVERWLGPDPRRPGKVVVGAAGSRGFRDARTLVTVRQRFLRHALLELRPQTGRGHQLRVHLASLGHPIVADADYGGRPLLLSELKTEYKLRPGVAEKPLLSRLFLHAERLELDDVDGQRLAVRAPLPADLEQALQRLSRFDQARS
jgi:RluA family pseudouridine synthase